MKKALIYAMLALLLAASCTEQVPEGKGTMRIIINEEASKSLGTIQPDGFPLEIVDYRISGSGPDGAQFTVTTDHTSESIEGVAYGSWTLTAEGLNENGIAIASGTTEFVFSPKNQNATITIDELIGEGTLTVDISWDASRIFGTPSITLQLAEQYGERKLYDLAVDINGEAGTASYSGDGHRSGSYTLSAQLYDDDVQVAGCTAAVRIADGQTSSGEIAFDLDNGPIEPGSMVIMNATGVPVKLTMEGIPEDGTPADEEITVSMSAENNEARNYNILWYLDGASIGEGESVTFSPTLGVHRLDVIASSSKIGSTSSTAQTFEAYAAGEDGTPNLGGTVMASSKLRMGDGMIVRFLDNGSLLIASNAHSTLYIGRLVRNDINVEKEISYATLGISGSTIADIAIKPAGAGYLAVFGTNSPMSIRYYTYDPDPMAFTCYFSENGPWEHLGVRLTESMFVGFGTDPLAAVLVAKTDDGQGARMIPFNMDDEASSANGWRENLIHNSSIWKSGYLPIAYEDGPDGFMGVAADGNILYGTRSGVQYMSTGMLMLADFLAEDTTVDAAIVGKDRILHLGKSLTLIDASKLGETLKTVPLGGSTAAALTVSRDYRFAYYLDLTAGELVSLSLNVAAASWNEIARTELPEQGLDSMVISPSGRNLLIYDKDDTDRIVLMRVSRE